METIIVGDVPVTLQVEVGSGWAHGTTVQVYTDFGTGTIDTAKPLLAVPFDPYRGKAKAAGWGAARFGSVPFGHGSPSLKGAGWAEAAWGARAWGAGAQTFELRFSVRNATHSWKFAVKAIDAAGNAQSAALNEIQAVVADREPNPPQSFDYGAHGGGIATFAVS